MKTPELGSWLSDRTALEGLLFFAQTWDEMLFDYALDSYQPRRFNVIGLCSELIDTYAYYEADVLSVQSISPIRDELLDTLKKDKTARRILGEEYPILTGVLKEWDPAKPDRQITFAAASISKALTPSLQSAIADQLAKAVADPQRKEDISDLAGRLLTEILRQGYSPSFVYFSLQSRFFKKDPVKAVHDIVPFLDLFHGNAKTYRVVFKMNAAARLLARNAKEDFLKTTDVLEPKFTRLDVERAFLAKSNDETFIEAPDVEAKDEYSARREAEFRLATASTLAGFLVHHTPIDPERDTLVYEGYPPTRAYRLGPARKPALRRPDVPDESFDDALTELVQAVVADALDEKTRARLSGALRAHTVGVNASIVQNQFSNLWTALETLASPSPDRNTIRVVLRRLVPVLCLRYFLKLVRQLRNDFRNCARPAYERCLHERKPDETDMDVFVRVLSGTADAAPLKDVLAACDANPLLRYRLFRYNEFLTSPDRALKALTEHEQRVTWHMQRLYRARNALIHAGADYDMIDLLTENVHDYLDLVFGELTDRIREDESPTSIEKIFSQCEWDYQVYKSALQNLKTRNETGLSAARLIVFGLRN